MTTMKNIPAVDLEFLLDLAKGNDTARATTVAKHIRQIESALTDTDLPEGVTVTEPEGRAWLLSSRDAGGDDRPIRIFHNEWEINLVISISMDADPYGSGPKMIKTELPTGLRIDTF